MIKINAAKFTILMLLTVQLIVFSGCRKEAQPLLPPDDNVIDIMEPVEESPPDVCSNIAVEVKRPDNSPFDVSASGLGLSKPNSLANEEKVVYQFKPVEFERIRSVELAFFPECTGEVHRMKIKSEGKIVFDEFPKCGEINRIDIDKSDLSSGTNVLRFFTSPLESYNVYDIRLTAIFSDGTDSIQDLYEIWFKETDETPNIKVQSLPDFQLTNIKRYSVDLRGSEITEDIIFEFDVTEDEGRLIVLVNDIEVYQGHAKKGVMALKIQKELLEDGSNIIEFIASP
ncbi:MAG: hypothetical protein KKF44_11295 [Nanoarchaeota archaeon]|nr:hypothetical protein [Nanoarchaeota archaeon]